MSVAESNPPGWWPPQIRSARFQPAPYGPSTIRTEPISDADIERIARRVAELLRADKETP